MYWKKGPSFSRRLELKVENDLRSSKHEKMISLALTGAVSSVCFFNFEISHFQENLLAIALLQSTKKIQKERRKMKKTLSSFLSKHENCDKGFNHLVENALH